MRTLIAFCFDRSRAALLALALILVAGVSVYQEIPKEADPDVQIPIIYVSMNHEGISPEDAERLLVRPMEKELRGLEGIKEMRVLLEALGAEQLGTDQVLAVPLLFGEDPEEEALPGALCAEGGARGSGTAPRRERRLNCRPRARTAATSSARTR